MSTAFKTRLEEFRYIPSKSSTPSPIPRSKKRSAPEPPSSRTPSPKKIKRSYAPPSTYSDLHEIQDYLEPHLDLVFCGINPGKMSAMTGHHFAHPTNHFWSCLHAGGLTERLLAPSEDMTLPSTCSIGMTKLVDRPTAEQSELSQREQVAAVPTLLNKVSCFKPKILCFVGLGIASYVLKHLSASEKALSRKSATVGLQPYKMKHDDHTETLFYAVPCTSGRVVKFTKSDKIQFFKDLHCLVEKMRNHESDGVEREKLVPIHSQS
ncbi:uracil-DNA glycosylase-like protein [Flagelloscypha sp. PMI_526]|nr:uracil-DNA glycosylase-like protein [Flagelloscypha sp. PMI_526]